MMTTDEAKLQIDYRKDFTTPAQIEALTMAQNALDEVDKYRKVIDDIKIDIVSTACASSFSNWSDSPAFVRGLEYALSIIDKHVKAVES